MKSIVSVVILLVTAFIPSLAKADNLSAAELAKTCKYVDRDDKTGFNDIADLGLCLGYVRGWVEGVHGLSTPDGDKVIIFEETTTTIQVVHVFIKFLTNNPEFENKTADSTLTRACLTSGIMKLKDRAIQPTGRAVQ